MGALRIHPDLLKTALNACRAEFNSGYLRIYDGTKPDNATSSIGSSTLLAELRFAASTPFATASFDSDRRVYILANAITADSSANNSGTATWFRILKSNGTTVLFDGTVGTLMENPDLLNSISCDITSGEEISIDTFYFNFFTQAPAF